MSERRDPAAAVVATGAASDTDSVQAHPNADLEALPRRARHVGRFSPSFFQTVDERDSAFALGERSSTVRGTRGEALAVVSRRFYRRLCMEGSGRLADGRVITFSNRRHGEPRFRVTGTPYGLTCRATPLVPYRSVAVDRRRIRLGSVLFIPAAKGLLLPDGSIHDGIFLADDVGSAVRGNKIDFFVGFDHHTSNLFTATKRILHARRVEVYVVPNDLAERVAARHRGAGAPLRVE